MSGLKLRGDPPFAVRTPDFLDGLPNLSMSDYRRVQEIKELLTTACTCPSVCHATGAHCHLEQPSGAMSWRGLARSLGSAKGVVFLLWLLPVLGPVYTSATGRKHGFSRPAFKV